MFSMIQYGWYVIFSFFLIHPFQGNATLHLYPHFKALQDIEGKIIFVVTGLSILGSIVSIFSSIVYGLYFFTCITT